MSEGSVTATAPEGGTATAVVTPAQVVTKTVEHERASDLPELDWGWRRWFIFLVTEQCVLVVAAILAWKTDDIVTIRMIARYALWGIGFMALLYIAGASTEGITKLVQAAKTTRKETTTETPQ